MSDIFVSLLAPPSPKPTFFLKWEVSVIVDLGEGLGGQYLKNLNLSTPSPLSNLFLSLYREPIASLEVCVTRPMSAIRPTKGWNVFHRSVGVPGQEVSKVETYPANLIMQQVFYVLVESGRFEDEEDI